MERPFRTWGYPFTPLLFLVLNGWMMVFALMGERWKQAMLGLLTVVVSGAVFVLVNWVTRRSGAGDR